jgi:hypothetical protein
MSIEAIEEALQAKPFVPFSFVLPIDRAVTVPHPEFVSISPSGEQVLVWHKRRGWSLIEPTLVVELAFNASKKR